MGYSYSHLDDKLSKWFKSDVTCASLHQIKLNGKLRSLNNIDVEFKYPITAFAGRNGCGKTTLLAIAACAYHNNKKGYSLKSRKIKYYTFSDFFIQTFEEVKPEGINIWYKFLYNNWKGKDPGFGYQQRVKRKGGKWNDYQKRIDRNVIFLGIDRIVPQTEKRVYKSYLKIFRDDVESDWYNDVQKCVGRILGRNYSSFKIKKAGLYDLQLVHSEDIVYSGFNMGAGEKALFELFSILFECANQKGSTMLIIDEIELGLHEVAQRKLIEVLKELCQKFKLQIICTTHSPCILESLPPEGRFYIERIENSTEITCGISGKFASGKLSDSHANELDLYVEDDIAATVIQSAFDHSLRQRVQIIPIGSHTAVCRQLAAAYKHPSLKSKSIAILDGDQRNNLNSIVQTMMQDLQLSIDVEKLKFKEWVKDKIHFLPGDCNPEKWIVSRTIQHLDKALAERFGVSISLLRAELKVALDQPNHYEFFHLSKKFTLSENLILSDLARFSVSKEKSEFNNLYDIIDQILSD